ncbi:MAG: UvrD-helicase domain-containing protein [Acidimicrobiales bacterium]
MSGFAPTPEQQAIIDAAATGKAVAISAGAGTGKTSTLRMIAEARPKTRMLYVAYNKAIQVEAKKSFPINVTAKTAHSLAYREFGALMRDRLNGPRMRGADTARILGVRGDFGFDAERIFSVAAQASLAMGMVGRFCRSADDEITAHHLLPPEGLTDDETTFLARHLLPLARRAWADLTSGPKGKCHPTHDVYLKQWQLSKPRLAGWDVILYDEAQDADPAIADVVEHQHHAQLVAVGDSAQAIYGWRGAGDFLNRVDAAHRLRLTQSWRFGQAVADEANVWLGVVGTDMRIVGSPHRDSTLEPLDRPDAILCRSNGGTIDALLDAHNDRVRVHLVGDGKEMLALAQAAQQLQDGKPAGHPELAAFTSWDQVVEYTEKDPAGSDLVVAVRMIEKYGADGVVAAIDGAVPERSAQLIVSTAHKAKGLEWDKVRVANDFTEPLNKETGEPLPIPRAKAMLAYVAVTRAMDNLDTGGLSWIHDHLEALGIPAGDPVNPDITPTALAQRPVPVLKELRPTLTVGSRVLVAEERGAYVVVSTNRDGSLTCYPATEQGGGARSFRPEWCIPSERPGKGGRPIRVRTVPLNARRARTLWREQHGFLPLDPARTRPDVAL